MPHRFTHSDEARLAGEWLRHNGRRYCAWQYEPSTRTLKASRGVVVRSASLEAETFTLEELKAALPQRALDLALEIRGPRH